MIRPAFAFSTGGEGTSLYQLAPDVVDLTDGSWTLYDPDSTIDTTYGTNGVTHSAGYNRVRWAGIGAGSSNYIWHSGTTIRAPRWYKLLKIDDNQITSDNLINVPFLGRIDTSVNDFNQQVGWGVCTDPTSVTASTLDASGGIVYKQTASTPGGGIFTENLRQASNNASNDKRIGALLRGGRNMIGGTVANLTAAGLVNGALLYAKAQNEALTTTANQYLFVGVGTETSVTVASGAEQSFSVRVSPISLNITIA